MTSVLEVNTDNWEREVLESNILTLVDFWHHRCPWCLRLNPVFEDVAEEYKGKVKFAKMNVLANSENRQLAINLGIMGTPTLVFFCKGRPLEAIVGFKSKDQLKNAVDEMIARHKECIDQSTPLQI